MGHDKKIPRPLNIGMVHNIIKCVQEEKELDRESREYFINVVLSNLIIFGKYDIGEDI